jgi:hypothetical protein
MTLMDQKMDRWWRFEKFSRIAFACRAKVRTSAVCINHSSPILYKRSTGLNSSQTSFSPSKRHHNVEFVFTRTFSFIYSRVTASATGNSSLLLQLRSRRRNLPDDNVSWSVSLACRMNWFTFISFYNFREPGYSEIPRLEEYY